MIDDKKIEEAARCNADKYRNYPTLSDEDRDKVSICSFMEGTKWMQEEFFKNLWHPVREEPRKDVSIIVETHNDKNMFYYAWNRWQDNFYPSWTDAVLCSRVSRWLYIDDLLPKEGGKQ